MKRNILLIVSLILFVVVFASFAFAGGKTEVESPVVVFVRTGPEAEGLRAVADVFTEKTGISVEMMEIGRSGYFSTMTTQLVSGTSAFDLVATNSAYVAQFAASGALEPLNNFLSKEPDSYRINDILFMYKYIDETYAIPFDVSTHFLYYRKDLISDPPDTWDEYLELAKQFTQAINPDSPTLYGTAFTALPGPELPKVFYSLMWSMGGEILDSDGKPVVDSPEVKKAASFYRSLTKERVVSPDIISWGFSNALDALQTGMIAMAAPYWNAAYPQIIASESEYKDKIGLALVPGVEQKDGTILRTPFQHGWSLAMNNKSNNKENAWKFFAFATSEEGSKIYAQNGGTPARESVLKDPDLQPRGYFNLILQSLSISRSEPAVPYYLDLHEIMNQALSKVLTSRESIDNILNQANRQLLNLVTD